MIVTLISIVIAIIAIKAAVKGALIILAGLTFMAAAFVVVLVVVFVVGLIAAASSQKGRSAHAELR
jgi:hypothetical protein